MQNSIKPPRSQAAANVPTISNGQPTTAATHRDDEADWDEAKVQPLTTLYQHQMILSPSHGEDEEDEQGKSPVAGNMIDFDEDANANVCTIEDTALLDQSGLDLDDMFENVFDEDHEEDSHSVEATPMAPTTEMTVISDTEETASQASSLKRRSTAEEGNKHGHPALKKTKPAGEVPSSVAIVVAPLKAKKTVKVMTVPQLDMPKMPALPLQPRRKRPMCLFVNHFGTRLNQKGAPEQVNVSCKTKTVASNKISCEETVSVKTKSTASSKTTATSHGSAKTPVNNNTITSAPVDTESPVKPATVPSYVNVVTPVTKRPIASSARIEDIHMEEDDLEPLRHDEEGDGDIIDCGHLPYIQSLTEGDPEPTNNNITTAASPTVQPCQPMMHPTMMTPPNQMLNFNRPFPLLQRRAFLNGCHPMPQMQPHLQAYGGVHPSNWHGYAVPAMGYPHPMGAYPIMQQPVQVAPMTPAAPVASGSAPPAQQAHP